MKHPTTTRRPPIHLAWSILVAVFFPRSGLAQSTTVVATVQDSTRVPIFPCRIDVLGTPITALGDSSGRVVLLHVPPGQHELRVRGIGFHQRLVSIRARGDTLRLPPVVLRHNPILDSLHIVAPSRGGSPAPSQKLAPNMRLKLSTRGGRLGRYAQGRFSILSAAAAGRSLSATR
jgi:hypothetical protein